MKKHFIMLSTALAAFGMTSCIDNEEPSSLEELRQAQAEKLKAEANKENANAEKTKAEAAYKQAEIKQVEAEVAATEAATEGVKLDNAKKAIKNAQAEFDLAQAKVAGALQNEQEAAQAQVVLAEAANKLAKAKAEAKAIELRSDSLVAAAQKALVTVQAAVATAEAQAEQERFEAAVAFAAVKANALNTANEETELGQAYATMTAKETDYITKMNELANAQQAYTEAVADINRTQAEDVVKKAANVTEAQYKVLTEEYAVEVAKKAQADFEEAAKLNNEAELVAFVNKTQDEIDALKAEINANVQAETEAANAVDAAKLALVDAYKKLNKEIDANDEIAKIYSFEIGNEDLAEDLAKKLKDDAKVNVENGKLVITATLSEVKDADKVNDDYELNKVVENAITGVANSEIVDVLEGILNKIDLQSAEEKAQAAQDLAEKKALFATLEKAYNDDLKTYNEAVAAYTKAAVAIRYNKEGENVQFADYDDMSAAYDEFLEDLKDLNKAIAAAEEAKDDEKITAAKANRTKAVNEFCTELAKYLKKRYAFDGFVTEIKAYYDATMKDKDNKEYQATQSIALDALRTAEKASYSELEAEAVANILATNGPGSFAIKAQNDQDGKDEYYTATKENVIGNNSRQESVVSKHDGKKISDTKINRLSYHVEKAGYPAFAAASKALMGGDEVKYALYTEEEIAEMVEENKICGGSQGAYLSAKTTIEQAAEVEAKEVAKATLYNAINKTIDEVEAKVEELNAKIDKTTLNDLVAAIVAAQAKETEVSEATLAKKREVIAKNNLKSAAEALFHLEKNFGDEKDGVKAAESDAYELYLAQAANYFANDIANAEQRVEEAKAALAKAEAEYEAFKAGNYSYDEGKSSLNAQLLEKQQTLDEAKKASETAKAEYETAKSVYDAIVAAIKAAIA